MYIDTGALMFCIAFVCMHALFMKFHVSRHMFLPKYAEEQLVLLRAFVPKQASCRANACRANACKSYV